MSTESDALPAGPVVERTAAGNGALSPMEAARSLSQARYKEQAETERQANPESAKETPAAPVEVPAVQESAGEADAAEPQAPPSETEGTDQEAPEQEQLPPITAPRSWTAEDKELFKALPRDTQERLVDRERSREKDFSQRQQKATEHAKALEAQQTAAEQARNQYEGALPMLLQALQEHQQGEFADIKSIADMEKLAREDFPRYAIWDAQQKKIAAVQNLVSEAQHRQQQEQQTKWQSFANDEDAKFLEKAPDLADKEAMTKAANASVEMLKDLGFSDEELGGMWNGQKNMSLRDHRVQLLIRDGLRYREAQAAVKTVRAAPKPPVQKPGASGSRASSVDAQIQALTQQMSGASQMQQARLGAQILTLQRQKAATRQ